jgi:hypothetical protein
MFPDGLLEWMIDILEKHPNWRIRILDNVGGGGSEKYVSAVGRKARQILKSDKVFVLSDINREAEKLWKNVY